MKIDGHKKSHQKTRQNRKYKYLFLHEQNKMGNNAGHHGCYSAKMRQRRNVSDVLRDNRLKVLQESPRKSLQITKEVNDSISEISQHEVQYNCLKQTNLGGMKKYG